LIVRAHGIFICDNCGHSLSPSDEYYECRCARCSEMNRISA
jgi:phage FluMu protein Com